MSGRHKGKILVRRSNAVKHHNGAAHFLKPCRMVPKSVKSVTILGLTQNGRPFRPSDWAERLAGVMSQFRPGGPQPGSHMSYSPWCVPTTVDGVRSVVIDAELRDYDVMAWDFCLNFARDNGLQVKYDE